MTYKGRPTALAFLPVLAVAVLLFGIYASDSSGSIAPIAVMLLSVFAPSLWVKADLKNQNRACEDVLRKLAAIKPAIKRTCDLVQEISASGSNQSMSAIEKLLIIKRGRS